MNDNGLESRALPHVRGLHPYTPGIQPRDKGWVKLNTNENPYPPSPRVEEAIRGESGEALRLYPDPRSSSLREAVAAHHGLPGPECVCIGNGSDDVLNLLTRAFCDGERAAAFTFPGYSLYPVLIAIARGKAIEVTFDSSMKLDVDKLVATKANMLFFTSPNAPTGVSFKNKDIGPLLEAFKGLVVVDEAYADFAAENTVQLLAKYPNLCVTRTFSKSYGLAGLRVGYLLGHPWLIEIVDRVRDSYNVNRLSQVGALAALSDQAYFQQVVGRIRQTRDSFSEKLSRLGWFTYPSQANFLFTEPRDRHGKSGKEVANELYEFLLRNKILVRYFPSHDLTSAFLRISVGSEPEMATLTKTIDRWLNNA